MNTRRWNRYVFVAAIAVFSKSAPADLITFDFSIDDLKVISGGPFPDPPDSPITGSVSFSFEPEDPDVILPISSIDLTLPHFDNHTYSTDEVGVRVNQLDIGQWQFFVGGIYDGILVDGVFAAIKCSSSPSPCEPDFELLINYLETTGEAAAFFSYNTDEVSTATFRTFDGVTISSSLSSVETSVPLPPAFWLLLSGVAGFARFARL